MASRSKPESQVRAKVLVDNTSPIHLLTPQQKIFVEALVAGKAPVVAGRLAGYASPETNSYNIMKQERIQRAVRYMYKKNEAVIDMDRKRVMDGFLEAIDMARMQADSGNMVAGWREIAKMCYYAPEVKKIDINVTAKRVIDKMETLSDEDLLRMVEESGQIIEMEASALIEHAQEASDAEEI